MVLRIQPRIAFGSPSTSSNQYNCPPNTYTTRPCPCHQRLPSYDNGFSRTIHPVRKTGPHVKHYPRASPPPGDPSLEPSKPIREYLRMWLWRDNELSLCARTILSMCTMWSQVSSSFQCIIRNKSRKPRVPQMGPSSSALTGKLARLRCGTHRPVA